MKRPAPVLYVFMRGDLPDHQPGKALAQCNHAGAEFVVRAGEAMMREGTDTELASAFEEWLDETGTFGTCVVLRCRYPELNRLMPLARATGLLSGEVFDPTYPIRNGHEIITAPVITCGWVFARRDVATNWRHLPLY